VEGAAQRVHEDTLRFVDGIYSCVATVLDSVLTLLVFTPVLLELGAQVTPPWPADTGDGWLVLVAVAGAVGGLGVSAFVGRHLVTLEVQNQRIEATLRTRLVLLAETPDAVLGRPATAQEGRAERAEEHPDDERTTSPGRLRRRPSSPSPIPIAPTEAFAGVLRDLWSNYSRLFRRFVYMNTWLALFDQTFVIVPYLLCAPLLFADDPAQRITLGTLVQVSNGFGRVFDSLAVVSESWTAVNAWRSVLRRLGEFEAQLYGGRGFRGSLLARTAAAAVELPLEPARRHDAREHHHHPPPPSPRESPPPWEEPRGAPDNRSRSVRSARRARPSPRAEDSEIVDVAL
jgi:peptide/bleomycin uptake transporter